MRVLICDDDITTRKILESILPLWGYETISTKNGKEALEKLIPHDSPSLIILDRLMPEIDGLELCRRLRSLEREIPHYIILLTVLGRQQDIVDGLEAGGDDYISKPFDSDELRVRLNVGKRIIELQRTLANRMHELENSISQNHTLRGLLPICSHCRRIKDENNEWHTLESYVETHSDAHVSHGICPDCGEKYYGDMFTKKE